MSTNLPSAFGLRIHLEQLLEGTVVLEPGPPVTPSRTCSVGIYVNQSLATRAVVLADLVAGANLGAAYMRITPSIAAEAVEARQLSRPLGIGIRGTFAELALLFHDTDQKPVRLYDCVMPGAVMPTDVAAIAARTGRRLDVRVQRAGYRAGGLSLLPV